MVKDHRTGAVTSAAEKTLDGELDSFMKAFLTCRITGEWARPGMGGDDV
jgi:protein subunit release factor B